MSPSSPPPRPPFTGRVVAREDALRELVMVAGRASRVAVDVEASGMFSYRARPCTVQLSWDEGGEVAVIDTLATSMAPLGELLGPGGPVKIVHDVAFDARLLAESGIALANVHDTAVAARMLSRLATGLANLLDGELGVQICKTLQQHDWRLRPLDERMLGYLADDVVHLEALEKKLWAEVGDRGIEDAVLEETRYRIATATAATQPSAAVPPYVRVKGAGRLGQRELAVLRMAAELREREAERRDVPPHKVASGDALLAIARTRPRTFDDLARIRGFSAAAPASRGFAADLLRAIPGAGETIPADERPFFEPVRMPAAVARLRRQREVRLGAWRRIEAKARGVDEQVVLPGHCVRDAVDEGVEALEDLARVPGLGEFRVDRYGEAILRVLSGEAELDEPGEADGAPEVAPRETGEASVTSSVTHAVTHAPGRGGDEA
jgi:ribonuclease D